MLLNELKQKIDVIKKEKDIAIAAHSYQSPEILEVADIVGDSFSLSVEAAKIPHKTVLMCGVRFMADTVKILSPDKKVVLAAPTATCPMAEQISPDRVLEYKKNNPSSVVVCYVNTTTELKAASDVCVTSSSALKIVDSIDAEEFLFIPDKNLGGYIKEQLPNKNIVLWDGYCPVHNMVTSEECETAKANYPNLKILAHPELPAEVLTHADVIGSTAAIIEYAKTHDEDFIIGTEKTITDSLNLQNPNRNYYTLSKNLICPDMRITTLTDVYKALCDTGGEEITIPEQLQLKAKNSIDKMIELGK